MKLEELIDEDGTCAVCRHEQATHCAKVGSDSNVLQIHCQSCPPLQLEGFSARHRLVSENLYIEDRHLVEHTVLTSCWSAFANKEALIGKSRLERSSNEWRNWAECDHGAEFRRELDEDLIDPKRMKHNLARLQLDTCAGCQYTLPSHVLTIDHILPKSKGGGNQAKNIQLLCSTCNSIKGDRDMEYLRSQLRRRRILKD